MTPSHVSPLGHFLKLSLLAVLFSLLTGCGGVSEQNQAKIAQVVTASSPQFEQETQAFFASDKRLSKLRNGQWKWEYKKGDQGKFLAQYGFKGDLPWWKTLFQVIFGPIANIFMDTDDFYFRTLEVDIQANTSKLIPNPD